jgi:hypothetical protein
MSRLPWLALCAAIISTAAHGQQLDCADFQRNPDGSWSPLRQMTIPNLNGGRVSMGPSVTFKEGTKFVGVDLGSILNRQCPRQETVGH